MNNCKDFLGKLFGHKFETFYILDRGLKFPDGKYHKCKRCNYGFAVNEDKFQVRKYNERK